MVGAEVDFFVADVLSSLFDIRFRDDPDWAAGDVAENNGCI